MYWSEYVFHMFQLILIILQDPQVHLEAKLRKQQMESEVDSKWLQQEEHNLVIIVRETQLY